MARLPQPGGDSGNWGAILNNFLLQVMTPSGQIKNDVIGSAQLQDGAVTSAQLATDAVDSAVLRSASVESVHLADSAITQEKIATSNTPSSGEYLYFDGAQLVWTVGPGGVVPDANASAKGVVQLAGDLAGSGSAAAAPLISAGAITAGKLANSAISDGHVSATAAIAQSKIANLTTDLAAKANISHTHAVTDITNLATMFVARVVYDTGSSAWPARPTVSYVEWVGPVDPGGLAQDGDTWVDTSP
jgi:hypothetical protein